MRVCALEVLIGLDALLYATEWDLRADSKWLQDNEADFLKAMASGLTRIINLLKGLDYDAHKTHQTQLVHFVDKVEKWLQTANNRQKPPSAPLPTAVREEIEKAQVALDDIRRVFMCAKYVDTTS